MADEFIKTTVTGEKALRALLKTLEPKLHAKALRKGLRAGAKVIAAEERALVPEDEGNLAASIKVRAGRRDRRFGSFSQVNVVSGTEAGQGDAYYSGFVNFGTVHQAADRFATQAFETTWPAAANLSKIEVVRFLRSLKVKGRPR